MSVVAVVVRCLCVIGSDNNPLIPSETSTGCSTVKKRRRGRKMSTLADNVLNDWCSLGDTCHYEDSMQAGNARDMEDHMTTTEILSQTGICKSLCCCGVNVMMSVVAVVAGLMSLCCVFY
jgi:hypothetical protein